jgi:hypothetical protein
VRGGSLIASQSLGHDDRLDRQSNSQHLFRKAWSPTFPVGNPAPLSSSPTLPSPHSTQFMDSTSYCNGSHCSRAHVSFQHPSLPASSTLGFPRSHLERTSNSLSPSLLRTPFPGEPRLAYPNTSEPAAYRNESAHTMTQENVSDFPNHGPTRGDASCSCSCPPYPDNPSRRSYATQDPYPPQETRTENPISTVSNQAVARFPRPQEAHPGVPEGCAIKSPSFSPTPASYPCRNHAPAVARDPPASPSSKTTPLDGKVPLEPPSDLPSEVDSGFSSTSHLQKSSRKPMPFPSPSEPPTPAQSESCTYSEPRSTSHEPVYFTTLPQSPTSPPSTTWKRNGKRLFQCTATGCGRSFSSSYVPCCSVFGE